MKTVATPPAQAASAQKAQIQTAQVQTAQVQTAQRVKVGMIGLAAVILLIGLASAIFSSVTRERPTAAAGAPRMASTATAAPSTNTTQPANEPLAEMGVAPSTVDGNGALPTTGTVR